MLHGQPPAPSPQQASLSSLRQATEHYRESQHIMQNAERALRDVQGANASAYLLQGMIGLTNPQLALPGQQSAQTLPPSLQTTHGLYNDLALAASMPSHASSVPAWGSRFEQQASLPYVPNRGTQPPMLPTLEEGRTVAPSPSSSFQTASFRYKTPVEQNISLLPPTSLQPTSLLSQNFTLPGLLRDTVAVAAGTAGNLKQPPAPSAYYKKPLPVPPKKPPNRRKLSNPNFPTRLMKVMVAYEREREAPAESSSSDSKLEPACFVWLKQGTILMVVDREGFMKMLQENGLLSKKATYTSFVRKMHRWGFVRKTGDEGHCFGHNLFRKGRFDLVAQLKSSWFDENLHS